MVISSNSTSRECDFQVTVDVNMEDSRHSVVVQPHLLADNTRSRFQQFQMVDTKTLLHIFTMNNKWPSIMFTCHPTRWSVRQVLSKRHNQPRNEKSSGSSGWDLAGSLPRASSWLELTKLTSEVKDSAFKKTLKVRIYRTVVLPVVVYGCETSTLTLYTSAVKNLKVRIYKTDILPVVLYGCETWTLTLREEQRLRIFENKVLRKIYGTKRDDVTGEWRKLHNAELHALHSSPDIIRNIKLRRLKWAVHVARMGESRNAYRVLVGRPEGTRPLGRPGRRWEHNIKMDLRKVGYDDREWINLAQDRDRWRAYVRAAMNLQVP
ncbi:hypothetical protein ANN_08042 [Periplaneta americana]|uniref:Uncharacterized protein n=1 Tax=Periplaneta americana TaxID=6978 RepID=A0ABQ8T1V5_PERAM|nr:hypothetical protein ANN_08042 [Periplaneta americana]